MTPPAWRMCWRRWAIAEAEAADGADMVILNTCHIREKASEKVFSELGRLRRLKDERAEAGGKHDRRRGRLRRPGRRRGDHGARPRVDMVVGPQSYHRLPEMIAAAARAGGACSTPISRPSRNSTSAGAAAPTGRAPF